MKDIRSLQSFKIMTHVKPGDLVLWDNIEVTTKINTAHQIAKRVWSNNMLFSEKS